MKPRKPLRNVIFDFGGVLVTWQPQEIIDSFYTEPALREALRRHAFQHNDWLDMDRGTLDEATVALPIEAIADGALAIPRRRDAHVQEVERSIPVGIEQSHAALHDLGREIAPIRPRPAAPRRRGRPGARPARNHG